VTIAQVAKCVGGVLSPLLANIALSVLDEHFTQAAGGPATPEWERRKRRRRGQANYRLVRYADLCRARHKSAYAESRVMPTSSADGLVRVVCCFLMSA
jgi:RNA-directed DNA polymerase